MNRCALVTGGSGFLGSFVVRDLLADGFESVVVLMRGSDSEEALARLRALWWERPALWHSRFMWTTPPFPGRKAASSYNHLLGLMRPAGKRMGRAKRD